MLRAGRPVLIVEHQGKRLTALASASRDDLTAAVACLPAIVGGERLHRHKLSGASGTASRWPRRRDANCWKRWVLCAITRQ